MVGDCHMCFRRIGRAIGIWELHLKSKYARLFGLDRDLSHTASGKAALKAEGERYRSVPARKSCLLNSRSHSDPPQGKSGERTLLNSRCWLCEARLGARSPALYARKEKSSRRATPFDSVPLVLYGEKKPPYRYKHLWVFLSSSPPGWQRSSLLQSVHPHAFPKRFFDPHLVTHVERRKDSVSRSENRTRDLVPRH
jgi:hypothetical protein